MFDDDKYGSKIRKKDAPIFNDYIYMNNNNIINDIILKDEIINNQKNIFKEYTLKNNFNDLFKRNRRGAGTSNGVTQPYTQIPSQTPSQVSLVGQGKSYNSNQMWSPQSTAGVVYEWNRGVVGVSFDGQVLKEKLDGTYNHHADATVRIANGLGLPIPMTNAPFQAAIDCSEKGLLVFQSEGDNAFVYFPNNISQEQLDALNDIVVPRGNFSFSYTHNEEIFEDQSLQDVLNYAQSITMKKAVGL